MIKRIKPQISAPRLDSSSPFYRIPALGVASPSGGQTGSLDVETPPRPEPGAAAPRRQTAIRATGENEPVNLARVAWLLTVLGCLVAVVILALDGYFGYAGVTFAVALSAAINLT